MLKIKRVGRLYAGLRDTLILKKKKEKFVSHKKTKLFVLISLRT